MAKLLICQVIFLIICNEIFLPIHSFEHREIPPQVTTEEKNVLKENPFRKRSTLCNNSLYDLAVGVCTTKDYLSHVLPREKFTIFVELENQNIHSVDDDSNSYSVDIKLILFWVDVGIKSEFSKLHQSQGYIPLSYKALKNMWTPDIHIFDLTNYKSYIDSQHVTSAKILYNNSLFKTDVGSVIEYKIEFRPTVYCKFEFKGYPNDRSNCRFIFGSQYENIRYIFMNKSFLPHHVNTGSHHCTTTMTNGTLRENDEFKNTIGLKIKIERNITPFIYRYFITCIASVFFSTLSVTFPADAMVPRLTISINCLLMVVSLYLEERVRFS